MHKKSRVLFFGGVRVENLVQAILKLTEDPEFLMLLPPFPESWVSGSMSPCLVYMVLGTEPRALCILGKHPSTGSHYQACSQIYGKCYDLYI